MFGLSKLFEIDTTDSTNRSLSYLNGLESYEKLKVIAKIEIFLKMVADGSLAQSEAFTAAMQAKKRCYLGLRLTDHKHPEFSMLQLIEDAYMTLNSHANKNFRSGKYSAIQFTNFMLENTQDRKVTTYLLTASGFNPVQQHHN